MGGLRAYARPSLSRDITVDVCVVGLGAAGLTALTEAKRLGLSAAGIDAGVIGGGASGRNGGFLMGGLARFHHHVEHPNRAALHRMTLDEVDGAPQPRTGSIRLAHDDAEQADCDLQYEAMRADGLPVERTPGGLLFPRDKAFEPVRRCLDLAAPLDGIYEHTPALDITGTAVNTPTGDITCRAVVVAIDGTLERVLPELQGRVRTARAQMLATAPEHDVVIPHLVYARWGYDYWQQHADGRVFLGGCRDRFEADEWDVPATPSAPVQTALDAMLRDQLGVTAPVTHRWAGNIAFTADGLPVLEEVRPGVWAAGAYSGTGNIVGPLTARAALHRAIGHPSAWADLLDH